MQHSDIRNSILQCLYQSFFFGDGAFNLHRIREEMGWEEGDFWKTVDYGSNEGLFRAHTAGGNYKITSSGVVHAEQNALVPEENSTRVIRARTLILDALAKVYEESNSSYASAHIETLSESLGQDLMLILNNLIVLEDLGYVEQAVSGHFNITYYGLEAVEEWQDRTSLAEEFERINEMNPQPRGRALQKLFAKVVEMHGWFQEEGARTSHEEIDVILHRQREYYLVECKWEKDPVEAPVIRELFGKLSNRIGVQGIMVSMSGFTRGAVKQAEDYANSQVIILFGSQDFSALIYEKYSFEDLLNAKYQELVTHKKAVFDQ